MLYRLIGDIDKSRCRQLCNLQARRFKGNRRYRRLLWRPSFPTDLPPALRQNAEILRYVAPETTPHKAVWTIHSGRRLHELVPDLCGRGAVEELLANIVFHALLAVDCKCPREAGRRTQNFRSDFFTACSNLFEAHHVHQGAECIFAVLSKERLRDISPDLRPHRRQRLIELVAETMEEWVALHQEPFTHLDAVRLLDIIGPACFLYLVPRLHLNIKALPGPSIDVLFHHVAIEKKDIFGTMRVALTLLPVDRLQAELGGSSWSLRRVLAVIEERRSEHALRFFLSNLDPPGLILEALAALRERDFDTGLLREKWAFFASKQLEADMEIGKPVMLDVPNIWPMVSPPPPQDRSLLLRALDPVDLDVEIRRKRRYFLTDGEFRPFSISPRSPRPLTALTAPSPLRDSPWPQLAFDPEEALAFDLSDAATHITDSAIDAYRVASGSYVGVDPLDIWTRKNYHDQDGVVSFKLSPSADDGLPSKPLSIDRIHFIDSAQGLSHVLTFLQRLSPAFVGIDLEWSDPHPVSLIQVATATRVFVIDAADRTSLFMSVLFYFMNWLLKNEDITKLFFGFPVDLMRLNMLFDLQGKTFGGRDHIASVIDLYMQRIRRVQVSTPVDEDTPLGREQLLFDAMQEGDLSAVQQLSAIPPVYPARERISEQVFTVGGHHSLASMTERYLGLPLDKSLRASNWNFRPLSAAQVIYAATDAHVLLALESEMRHRGILPQRVWGASRRRNDSTRPAWWLEEPVRELLRE